MSMRRAELQSPSLYFRGGAAAAAGMSCLPPPLPSVTFLPPPLSWWLRPPPPGCLSPPCHLARSVVPGSGWSHYSMKAVHVKEGDTVDDGQVLAGLG